MLRRIPLSARLPLAVLLVAVVAAAAVLLLRGGGGGGEAREGGGGDARREVARGLTLSGPPDAPFALQHPESWQPLESQRLAQADPPPVAGIRREDDTGVLTVSVRGPVRGGIDRLEEMLPRELEQRVEGFRLVTARRLQVAAGPALYVAWSGEGSDRLQSTLVVPDGNRRSFSVDAVVRGDARPTAQEVGAMLRTFSLPGR